MESWRLVWRKTVPLLSTAALLALREALLIDDPCLIQGATTIPPPLQCVATWPVEAACLLGYAGWKGDGLQTVEEVEGYFARLCFEIDRELEEPAGCRFLLNWHDETPRDEVRRELLPEILLALAARCETF
jgi:hypothetical protein